MQCRIIDNKVTTNLLVGLLLAVTSVAFADDSIRKGQTYEVMLAENQSNPWALPSVSDEQQPEFNHPAPDLYYQYPDNEKTTTDKFRSYNSRPNHNSRPNQFRPGMGSRFVTPEILESLKQQQTRQQEVRPHSPDYYKNTRRYNSNPQSNLGYVNPLYDVPAVSPWGNGLGLLYRGTDLPWMPDAALDGIPPIPVSPYVENETGQYKNQTTEPVENASEPKQDTLFNPFTFVPNRRW
ncbi:MAG: hypothetical protein RQ982_11250 [Gammaproteobacteria bacterium]|nr:hypothetical protein [Gammaproteobacteria bacterium]